MIHCSDGLQFHIHADASETALKWLPGILAAAVLASAENLLGLPYSFPLLAAGAALAILLGRLPRWCAAAAALSASLMLALVPAARGGVLMLLNRLFSLSEAGNRYAYRYFIVEAGSAMTARILLAAALSALCPMSFRPGSGGCVLLWAILFTAAQVYFGLSVSLIPSAVLLAALVCTALRDTDIRSLSAILGLTILIFALTAVLVPGTNSTIEARSEAIRDLLEPAAAVQDISGPQPSPSAAGTRRENRLQEQERRPDTDGSNTAEQYQKQTEYEQNISKPERINYRKILLLLLGLAALLIVPFLPFYLISRRRQLALAKRRDFDSPDCSLAVRAMFSHLVQCLAAFGAAADHGNFSEIPRCLNELPASYAEHFSRALPLWQAAAYSPHPLGEEEKRCVSDLLRETETLVDQRSNRKLRFRLHYIDCLLVKEDAV